MQKKKNLKKDKNLSSKNVGMQTKMLRILITLKNNNDL